MLFVACGLVLIAVCGLLGVVFLHSVMFVDFCLALVAWSVSCVVCFWLCAVCRLFVGVRCLLFVDCFVVVGVCYLVSVV